MVHDLVFESHPNKLLEKHINGVLQKSRFSFDNQIGRLACLLHDLGKINPNFQKKLKGETVNDYSNHAYISVCALVNFTINNQKLLSELFNTTDKTEFFLRIHQIISLIAHHHGDIPNFEALITKSEFENANNFLIKNELLLSEFLEIKLEFKHNKFISSDLNRSISQFTTFSDNKRKKWQEFAIDNFLNTQFSFASLIEADKRDAGDLNNYSFNEKIEFSINELSNSLETTFQNFKSETELNKLRTDIRIEAANGIKTSLANNKRIFTLTAPTGAGKTYALLSLANEIQKLKGKLGIIYALPFLSITEQVEKICNEDLKLKNVLSINSKSNNERIDEAQKLYESNQNAENLKKILTEEFTESTFDHPFIITTFVQLFETLVSNKNSTLLKLPNFANRIFLIDEVQALPPRLYIFFTAWLDAFCRKNNSYTILSTATMPHFQIKNKEYLDDLKKPELLFKEYCEPSKIIENPNKYFDTDTFNRYKIEIIENDNFTINSLIEHINQQTESCLVILNTIDDTKQLYEAIKENSNAILLNTHFIPEDRIEKIRISKEYLKNSEKIVLVSTQLIEAGVDIDFPIVYRDLCPLPSLIQSAGRCNRNKKIDFGQVYMFELKKDNGKSSSELIYRKEAKEFLNFSKQRIKSVVKENELFEIQKDFFKKIAENLTVGEVEFSKDDSMNMIECVNKAEFEKLGKFELINKISFGEQTQYYIRKDDNDNSFNELQQLIFTLVKSESYKETMAAKSMIGSKIKKMSNRILNVRITDKNNIPNYILKKELCGIRFLQELDEYTFEYGLKTKSFAFI